MTWTILSTQEYGAIIGLTTWQAYFSMLSHNMHGRALVRAWNAALRTGLYLIYNHKMAMRPQ